MATIAKTAFEVSNSNISRNSMQNVPGKFGTGTGSGFKSEVCPAGFLCVQGALLPNEGYEGKGPNKTDILNGNTWEFVAAASGNVNGFTGDHTGIYAFNSYDVRKVASGDNVWMLGSNFLGLELPAGERGDFTELIVGEQYTFGEGNFSTLPVSGSEKYYATIVNGLLVASTSVPAAGKGVYLEILRKKPFTTGARYAGFDGYVCRVLRTAAVAAGG